MPGMAPGTSREEGHALDLRGLAEQFVKFGVGLGRLRSRAWINDVTRFSYEKKEVSP